MKNWSEIIKNSPFFQLAVNLQDKQSFLNPLLNIKWKWLTEKDLELVDNIFWRCFAVIFDVFLTIFLTSFFYDVLAYFLKALFFLENAKNIQLYKKFLQFTHLHVSVAYPWFSKNHNSILGPF